MLWTVEREHFLCPRAPEEGVEAFAVGDIHGRPDLLEALLAAAANEPKRAARRELIFLGDLVDRGPANLDTIVLSLQAGARIGADKVTYLMGNHETMMRLALDPATPRAVALEALANWVRNGGGRVLDEFDPELTAERDPRVALIAARAVTPEYVKDWLDGLQAHARSGGLLFVHAGVHPERSLEAYLARPWNTPLSEIREAEHWAWIRGAFLAAEPGPEGFFGYMVVHGHSPGDLGYTPGHAEQIARCRLNLDGGSGLTGRAKLGIFRGQVVEVLTTRGPRNGDL